MATWNLKVKEQNKRNTQAKQNNEQWLLMHWGLMKHQSVQETEHQCRGCGGQMLIRFSFIAQSCLFALFDLCVSSGIDYLFSVCISWLLWITKTKFFFNVLQKKKRRFICILDVLTVSKLSKMLHLKLTITLNHRQMIIIPITHR